MKNIVLASTSIFRKQLLEKLNLEFKTASPEIDESALPGESPQQLVERLSALKAKAVGDAFPDSLIIGSDQVACVEGQILNKPGNFENAFNQLQNASGKIVSFYTGLALYNSSSAVTQTVCETFNVHFRQLSVDQITRYLEYEKPYNCAGSFKSEGFGICLFDKLDGDDPNTLVGLPLIQLIRMLEKEGIAVP